MGAYLVHGTCGTPGPHCTPPRVTPAEPAAAGGVTPAGTPGAPRAVDRPATAAPPGPPPGPGGLAAPDESLPAAPVTPATSPDPVAVACVVFLVSSARGTRATTSARVASTATRGRYRAASLPM